MVEIQTTEGITFSADAEETVLDAALSAGLFFPHSCKSGRCNTCRCRVVSGEFSNALPPLGLSVQETKAGYALGCAIMPRTDLILDKVSVFPFALPKEQLLPCRIFALRNLCQDIIELEVRFPPGKRLHYLPGQFVDILFQGIQRSYSIANVDHNDGNVCFHIKRVADGVFSEYLFEKANLNDLLRIRGPYGTFFPRDVVGKHLVFLSTGTGYGPVAAIIKNLLENKEARGFESISLFRGVRRVEELYKNNEKMLSEIAYHPTVSQPSQSWKGDTDYVQKLAIKKIDNLSNVIVFACGSIVMVEDAKSDFGKNGINDENFFSDAFISSG